MVSERWNTVRWGSNTALNPAVRRFIETFDEAFNTDDTTVESLDTTHYALDTAVNPFNPAIDRIVETFNSTLLVITQS